MVVFHSLQPKHRLKLTLFSTLELCGTDEGSKSTSFNSKGRSREFLGTFFGKNCEALMRTKEKIKKPNKVPAIAWHEGRKGCAEKALATEFASGKIRNSLIYIKA